MNMLYNCNVNMWTRYGHLSFDLVHLHYSGNQGESKCTNTDVHPGMPFLERHTQTVIELHFAVIYSYLDKSQRFLTEDHAPAGLSHLQRRRAAHGLQSLVC